MKPLILLGTLAVAQPAAAAVTLFADTFDDELGNINGTPNASVSGVYAQTDANNYSGLAGSFTETGGQANLIPPGGTASGLLYPIYNFATDSDVQSSGTLTISLGDITPASGQWLAIDILYSLPYNQNIYVNQSSRTTLGILFSASGSTSVFESGAGVSGASAWNATNNVSLVMTNITGLGTASGSFNYEIFSGTTSLFSDSHTGNLTNLYVGLESRTGTSAIGSLEITTVPEPAATLLGALGLLGLLRRRR